MFDIMITTYNRVDLLKETVDSLLRMLQKTEFRLHIIDDFSPDSTPEYLSSLKDPRLVSVILSKKRYGVVHGFNRLWNEVEFYDSFHARFPYLCYLQDDLRSCEEEWLLKITSIYEELRERHEIGFFSGHDAPEHPVSEKIQHNGVLVVMKRSQGGTNLIAGKDFWYSIGKVPRNNPNGQERGFPANGRGSHLDVYLVGCASGSKFIPWAAAANCSFRQGKKVMVVPGLLHHMGHEPKISTWRG